MIKITCPKLKCVHVLENWMYKLYLVNIGGGTNFNIGDAPRSYKIN